MNERDVDLHLQQHIRTIREDSARTLRGQLGLSDDVDVRSPLFMRFIIRLTERLNWDIPRDDYPRLATMRGCLEYVRALPA